MAIDKLLRKSIEELVQKYLDKNESGGFIIIGGNAQHNQSVIDSAVDVPFVLKAEEVEFTARLGKDIKISIAGKPKIEVSYDGGKSWSNT